MSGDLDNSLLWRVMWGIPIEFIGLCSSLPLFRSDYQMARV